MSAVEPAILSIGSYAPEKVLTNHDLEKMVDTSDEWITTRSGIKERRIAGNGASSSDLALRAARRALEAGGIDPADLDLVVLSSSSPDYTLPASACLVQGKLGAVNAGAYDVLNACSGFLNGLELAAGLVAAGTYRRVLVSSGEKMSSIVNWKDRNTCVLFGDGGGAAVVGPAADGGHRILASLCRSDGTHWDYAVVPGGGSRQPLTAAGLEDGQQYLKIQGRELFKAATQKMPEILEQVAAKAQVKLEDVDLVVPHQMNTRIMEAAAKRMSVGMDRFFVNIQKYGNTASASIPLALVEAEEQGRLQPGQLVVLVAFGGGISWAAMMLRW